MRLLPQLLKVLTVMVVGLSVSSGAAAQCQSFDEMEANFLRLYPTGGTAGRHTGDRGQAVMDMLLYGGPGDAVAFLYSGDGPTTGARGRYMYLILDDGGCIVKHGWLDGKVYDRVVADE